MTRGKKTREKNGYSFNLFEYNFEALNIVINIEHKYWEFEYLPIIKYPTELDNLLHVKRKCDQHYHMQCAKHWEKTHDSINLYVEIYEISACMWFLHSNAMWPVLKLMNYLLLRY